MQISFYFFLNLVEYNKRFETKVTQIMFLWLKINLFNWAQKKMKIRCLSFNTSIMENLLWCMATVGEKTNKQMKQLIFANFFFLEKNIIFKRKK